MKRTRIRLGWTDWRHRIMLCGLYLFYRLCNAAGLGGLGRNTDTLNLGWTFLPSVESFLDEGRDGARKIHVYNYQTSDGRVVTVMIAQVCGKGPFDSTPPHV